MLASRSCRPNDSWKAKAFIVDAKWGGLRWRRNSLRDGTASQLAFYAHLLQAQPDTPATAPAVAFFVLMERSLITPNADVPDPAGRVDGPDPASTWFALERAFAEREGELSGGRLGAPAVPYDQGNALPERDALVDEQLVLTPRCLYCDYGGLCGLSYREVDA